MGNRATGGRWAQAAVGTHSGVEATGHQAQQAGGPLRKETYARTNFVPASSPEHRQQSPRMLFSGATGTLPVSPHNRVLQYLNYKLKIIFTGVILNITRNFLTLRQPHHTNSCCRLPAHGRHMADTGTGNVRLHVSPNGVCGDGCESHVTDRVCVRVHVRVRVWL